jgi:hypothetical protein
MKRNLILTGIIIIGGLFSAYNFASLENEAGEAEIKELVESAYIHGAFNELNPEAMANGFHKDFAIFSAKGEELSRYEIEDWVAGVKKRQSSAEFDPKNNVWEHKFAIVDVTGNSAIAKVELSKDGKHVYTDYLSLLKFDTGWKIVAKVYTKHE